MKIGVKLPNSGPFATAEYIRKTAIECERLDYDSIWVHDHLHRSAADARSHFVAGSEKAWETWEGPIQPNVFESVTTLFYVAGATENIELGVSVVVLPLRNPMWLAKYFACLDHFTGGRAILGIGSGGGPYIKAELEALGAPELAEPRGRVIDEWVAIMRRVWEDAVVNYDGEFLQIRNAEVFPKPVQERLPIWFGGNGRRVRERIARDLDGWLPMFKSPADLRADADLLFDEVAKVGRHPSEFTLASEHWLAIDEDGDAAAARAEQTHRRMMAFTQQFKTPDVKHIVEREQVNLVGTPEAVLDLVCRYQEVGVDHIILRIVADDFGQLIEQLNMFKELVKDKLASGSAAKV